MVLGPTFFSGFSGSDSQFPVVEMGSGTFDAKYVIFISHFL